MRTPDGDILCDRVVLATGAWARDLLAPAGVDAPIALKRIQVAVLRQPAGAPRPNVVCSDAVTNVVVRPDRGALFCAVTYFGDEPLDAADDCDHDASPGYEEAIRRALAGALSGARGRGLAARLGRALRLLARLEPDHRRGAGREGLHLALAWSGHGFKLSPAVGEVVAAEVMGAEPPIDVTALRPTRFAEGKCSVSPTARAPEPRKTPFAAPSAARSALAWQSEAMVAATSEALERVSAERRARWLRRAPAAACALGGRRRGGSRRPGLRRLAARRHAASRAAAGAGRRAHPMPSAAARPAELDRGPARRAAGCRRRGARRPGQRMVALTFDDGPSGRTPAILRVLAHHHAHATFFVVGRATRGLEPVMRHVAAAGNELADHTYSHADLLALGAPGRVRSRTGHKRSSRAPTGVEPRFFRPPYGATGPEVNRLGRSLRLVTARWSVDSRDWQLPGTRAIVRRVSPREAGPSCCCTTAAATATRRSCPARDPARPGAAASKS